MAKGLVEQSSLTAIADAIRAKGVEGNWKPAEMAGAIANIPAGGGVIWTPEVDNSKYSNSLEAITRNTQGDSPSNLSTVTNYWIFDLGEEDIHSITLNIKLIGSTNQEFGLMRISVGYVTSLESARSFTAVGILNKAAHSGTWTKTVNMSEAPVDIPNFLCVAIANKGAVTSDTAILDWITNNQLSVTKYVPQTNGSTYYLSSQTFNSTKQYDITQGSLNFNYNGAEVTLYTAEGVKY